MANKVRMEIVGPIATITNHNPDKHNAFDDDMDATLFDILAELRTRPDVRAVVWRGEGKSFSSGRDVGAIGLQPVSKGPRVVLDDVQARGAPVPAVPLRAAPRHAPDAPDG